MTENEAIKHLQSYAEVVDNMIKYCKDFEPKADITGYLEKKTVFAMAISALKEVQKYSEIGTVEECKELASMATTEKKNVLCQIVDEWKEYIEIGTVEECREAVEKQKAKKKIYPKTALERYYHAPECPNCKRELRPQICGYTLPQAIGIYSNCPWCGQALMNADLEGMEDE